LWTTSIDATQLESALLDLTINARDAMDGQGKLTIEAASALLDDAFSREHPDFAPWDYVVNAVTETGLGVAPEVQEKAFEPFVSYQCRRGRSNRRPIEELRHQSESLYDDYERCFRERRLHSHQYCLDRKWRHQRGSEQQFVCSGPQGHKPTFRRISSDPGEQHIQQLRRGQQWPHSRR
jgi:hypothetical protein